MAILLISAPPSSEENSMMALVPDDEDDAEDHVIDEEEEELFHDLSGDAEEMQRLNREIFQWNLKMLHFTLIFLASKVYCKHVTSTNFEVILKLTREVFQDQTVRNVQILSYCDI